MDAALEALQSVDFDWTTHIDSVWRDLPYNVPEFQEGLRKEALSRLERLFAKGSEASPLGLVLAGPGGSGKTHMLSLLRAAALQRGAFFVLVDMTDVRDFWETTLLGYTRSLPQNWNAESTQQETVLRRLVERAATKVTVEQLRRGKPPALINLCNTFIDGLRKQHKELQEHADVLRALVLFGNDDLHLRDLGWKWLLGVGVDEDERLKHGFQRLTGAPREIVRGISSLMSMAGPTLLALDQLDAIVAELQLASSAGVAADSASSERSTAALAIIQGIAKGLIALRDTTKRTQTVVACLEQTWSILVERALVSMHDRFFPPLLLRPVVEANQVQRLVELRLATAYEQSKYSPPYKSFPYPARFSPPWPAPHPVKS